jgi:hypothetical protein
MKKPLPALSHGYKKEAIKEEHCKKRGSQAHIRDEINVKS